MNLVGNRAEKGPGATAGGSSVVSGQRGRRGPGSDGTLTASALPLDSHRGPGKTLWVLTRMGLQTLKNFLICIGLRLPRVEGPLSPPICLSI